MVNGTASSGTYLYTLSAPGVVQVGQAVTGTNVGTGTQVVAVSGTSVWLSAATTGAVTNATFDSRMYTLSTPGNVYAGQLVTGTGIPANTTVSYVDGVNVRLSAAVTANVTNAALRLVSSP